MEHLAPFFNRSPTELDSTPEGQTNRGTPRRVAVLAPLRSGFALVEWIGRKYAVFAKAMLVRSD